ncbi:ComEC/Rec2 family competence protein [Luteolibacter luteus]|uniref:DUF4131 domain-containing protein n=1 Tax=Luteolibacter luteus TaxID=2728835 RepID=A0A858RH63_9BACT|nr:ComEC/Rec2 family competence protein [Luteolibacter luteus]QJE96506.1 DUF4131 domain-containing protein [Luteolibacter luteus]
MRAKLRRTVERHPLLWIAAAAAAAVMVADGCFVTGAVTFFAVIALLLAAGLRWVVISALALALAAGSLHSARVAPQKAARAAISGTKVRTVEATGRVATAPKVSGGGWTALVDVVGPDPKGKVWWWGRGLPPLRGETIRATGDFLPIPERRNPGTFDVANWLHREGVWGVFDERGQRSSVSPAPWLDQKGEALREDFRLAVTSGLDEASREAAVIRAMVLGDSPTDDEALVEAYRASGTLHVFSVSGMHVAMIGVIGWFALKWLRVPRRAAIVVIILGMFAYAWITGMKPPAVRSVTMGAVLLGAFFIRRRPDLLNTLGFALMLAVLANGHLIFQAGVQLSFGVVFVMGIATTWATRPFAWISWREPYLPLQLYTKWQDRWLRIRQQIATAFGASTAASVGSVPLTLWHFGFLSPISILASTLIGIFVLALMALALLALFLSPIAPSAQRWVNKGNGYVAAGCTGIARFFASVPGGNHTFARDRPGENFLVVYDPGYGNGAALLHEGGSTVLFDTGSANGFEHMLLPSLRHFSVKPQHLVLSHPDGGHIGGAAGAIDAFPIRQILAPVTKARSKLYRDLIGKAEQRGIPVVLGDPQGHYKVSEATWLEVIHEPDAASQNMMADERVMVCRLHWRGWRILFMGDAGWSIERAMLESGRDLSADVIVAGRHRNDSSMGDAFLEAVKPRAIIASHADFPYAERIPPGFVSDCESRGIRLFHQGQTGAVTGVPREDGSLELRGFLDGSSLRLSR